MSVCEAMLVMPPVLFSTEVMSLLTLALFQISWSWTVVTESQWCCGKMSPKKMNSNTNVSSLMIESLPWLDQLSQVRHPCSSPALSYPKRYKELLWGLWVLSYVEIVPPSPWHLGRTGRRRRRSWRSRGARGAPRPGGEGGH